MTSSHCSAKPADDLTDQPDANEVSEYPAQDEEGDENHPEGLNQATIEQQTDDADSGAPAVDRFGEGESSNEAEPGQAQPAGDEGPTTSPLPGDEHTEQPIGVVQGDHEEGTTVVAVSDGGYPGSAEDLDTAAVREHSDVHNAPPPGGNSTEYEGVVATNEDYEAYYNGNDPDSDQGEAVTIEGDTREGDWETAASDAPQTQDDLGQHGLQHDAAGVDKGERAPSVTTTTDDLTPPSTGSNTQDLTAPGLGDGSQQGNRLSPTPTSTPSNKIADTDTDSIGQQTSDEFADAQEESRDDHRPHEGDGSNSNTGEFLLPDPFQLALTQPLDQSNDLIPDIDHFGDDFNWDEDFGGDFDDGEYGEFEDQSNVETKTVDPPEPVSGKSSKRGFDEIDSETVDEEQTLGDVSPSKFLPHHPYAPRDSRGFPRLKTEEGAVVRTCAGWTPFERICGPAPISSFHSHLFPPTTDPRSSISPCSRHKHLLSNQALHREGTPGMKSLLTLTGFHPWDEGLSFWASDGSCKTTATL